MILTYIAVPERNISLKWREKRPLCPKFMACPTYALVPNLHLERHQSAVPPPSSWPSVRSGASENGPK